MESLSLTHAAFTAHEQAAEASPQLQALWFRLASAPWRSLLLVPAGGANALHLARGLLGIAHAAAPSIALLDATAASVGGAAALVADLQRRCAAGERVLVAVDSIDQNPASLALASACDAALLCVALGKTGVEEARNAVERCGRARFVGTAVVLPGR